MGWFIKKESSGASIPHWYETQKYGLITDYIVDETRRFIHFYQFLKKEIFTLKNRYVPIPEIQMNG